VRAVAPEDAPAEVAAAPEPPLPAAPADPAAGPVLDADKRAAVEAAIDELSQLRKWLAQKTG
jgi:hypothetical protein